MEEKNKKQEIEREMKKIMIKNEKWTDNNIGDEGTRMISESLKTNTSLTILDLHCDEIEWNEMNISKMIYIQRMKWNDNWYEQGTILETQEQEW